MLARSRVVGFSRACHALWRTPKSDLRGSGAALRRPRRVALRWNVRASAGGPCLSDSAARCPYHAWLEIAKCMTRSKERRSLW